MAYSYVVCSDGKLRYSNIQRIVSGCIRGVATSKDGCLFFNLSTVITQVNEKHNDSYFSQN